ncbi:MAG: response regulator [Chloroflexota bacterium]
MEKRARILLVDDEFHFATGLQAVCESKGHQVVIVSNRPQAEESLRAERPELVILGTITPRGDAFGLHQWIRQSPNCSDVPMVVLDAAVDDQVRKGWTRPEGLQLQADDYFYKPLEPIALMPVVQKLLDRATKRIKVLVADDHAVVRDGIRALLSLQKDMQVVGEAVDGKEAASKTRELLPDVVLMDIVMPVMNGLDATRAITKECERVKVLMLSQYDDEENVMASEQAGALGFIPKKSASSQLLAAIRSADRGERSQEALTAS